MSNKRIHHPIKGIVLCKESGEYLIDLILDSDINPVLLSSFVGALSLFGRDNLGKIEEISVTGLEIDMIIVVKYNLILIAILAKEFAKNIDMLRSEIEKALDIFYSSYQEEIAKAVDVSVFDDFKGILKMQIEDYLEKIQDTEKEKEIGDFGFFTEAVKKSKDEEED